MQYLWVKLIKKACNSIAFANILCSMNTQKLWRNVRFPLYIFSKKNLGENGILKRPRNLTIQSAVKREKGPRAFKSAMYYMFDISQSMGVLGVPFLLQELALMLGWRETIWIRAHFSCLSPASFSKSEWPTSCSEQEGRALQGIRMGWSEMTAMQSHGAKMNHIRSLLFLTTGFRNKMQFTGFVS